MTEWRTAPISYFHVAPSLFSGKAGGQKYDRTKVQVNLDINTSTVPQRCETLKYYVTYMKNVLRFSGFVCIYPRHYTT